MLSVYLEKASIDVINLEVNLVKEPLAQCSKLETATLESYLNHQPLDLTSYRGLYLCINFMSVVIWSQKMIKSTAVRKQYLQELISFIKEYGEPGSSQLCFEKMRLPESLLELDFEDISSLLPASDNVY